MPCIPVHDFGLEQPVFKNLRWKFHKVFQDMYSGSGGDNSVSILLARLYFSVETFGRASATQMVAMAAGGGVSPWIAGLVHDRTGNYDLALLMAAACMGGAALAAAWLPEFRPGDDSTAQRLGAGG